jgi:hypothetical protein
MDEYDRTDCPYCGVTFESLPRAKKRCPACARTVWVRSGPDGRHYILREADLATHDALWEAHRERMAVAEAARLNLDAARLTREALRSYSAAGLRRVEWPALAISARRVPPSSADSSSCRLRLRSPFRVAAVRFAAVTTCRWSSRGSSPSWCICRYRRRRAVPLASACRSSSSQSYRSAGGLV